MAQRRRPSTTSTSASASYPFYAFENDTTTHSRPKTSRTSREKPTTRGTRPAIAASTIARIENQHVVCAVSESRGISPTVGLAFINLDTGEAVLCQICDSQTYVRTIHKLHVYAPTDILVVQTASNPKSKLFSIIEENLDEIGGGITLADRGFWSESAGMEHLQHFAFTEDVEAIKLALEGNYFAVCCFAAVVSLFVPSLLVAYHDIGSQIHRIGSFKDVPFSFAPNQIRAFRRKHDDRHLNNSCP